MKEFTSEEIQKQFETLPPEVQSAVTSTDVNAKIEAVGKRHNLLIDQLGELVDEIGLVMLGLRKSSHFVDDMISRLSISRDEAGKIAAEVNTEVFSAIKGHLQEMEKVITDESPEQVAGKAEETKTRQQINVLERVGGFSIDNNKPAGSEAPANLPTGDGPVTEDRNKILQGIENPQPSPTHSVPQVPENHTDPLIDHLLSSPVSIPQQKTVQNTPVPVAPTPQKASTPDPYKEHI